MRACVKEKLGGGWSSLRITKEYLDWSRYKVFTLFFFTEQCNAVMKKVLFNTNLMLMKHIQQAGFI